MAKRNASIGLARRRLALAAGLALGSTVWAAVTFAHGGRLSLFFWGSFPPKAVTCQRSIARSFNTCALKTLSEHIACTDLVVAGEQCDQTATDAAVDAIRIMALDTVDAGCNEQLSTQLGFLSGSEVQSDLSVACHRADTTLMRALYPTPTTPTTLRGADRAQCQQATALAARHLLRFANRVWETTFNRMARRNPGVTRSTNAIANARRRVAHAVDRLVAMLQGDCPAASFAAIYGVGASQLLGAVGLQAECLAGSAYVQDRIQCDATPTPSPIMTPPASPTQ